MGVMKHLHAERMFGNRSVNPNPKPRSDAMSNELTSVERTLQFAPAVYDRAADVPAFLTQIGQAIHSSGMFGTEMPSQGQILALECMSRRIPPLMLAERYNMIKGTLSMKADAMLGDFRSSGGKHRIIERGPECAVIELTRDGQTCQFSLSWEEAQREPFVYVGKESAVIDKLAAGKGSELSIKPKYATPRSRSQMLWARVVSDGVRAMAPEIVAGHYTPEEVSDFDGNGSVVIESPTPTPAPSVPVSDNGQAAASGSAAADTEPASEPATSADEQPGESDRATAYQIAEARQLVRELEVKREKLEAMLAKVGAAKVSDLSHEHCEHLLELLRRERDRRQGKNE